MKHKKVLSTILVMTILLSGSGVVAGTGINSETSTYIINDVDISLTNPTDEQGIRDFVSRMYSVCLGRSADDNGLNDWSSRLLEKRATGASVAYGFIFSNEFQEKQCTNTEYVTYMYNAFFGRQPDPAGLADWVGQFDSGISREHIFCGFANSLEFESLCADYGIVRGFHAEGYDYEKVAQVNLFVERLYNVVLGRECDREGMGNWTNALLSGKNTGALTAYGFFFSEEYKNQGKTDVEYVNDLYHAFMGREADDAGRDSWLKILSEGGSMEKVFDGFAQSDEFGKICESYGIIRGNSVIKPVEFNPVPLNELANYSSIRKRMSDTEFREAYNAALEIVRPLAGLSLEDQLYGVAIAIRGICDNGLVYSTSNPHYNDPYGYFILGTASCAGCARATGLCLNILGISYEHVNENQNSHQWARINVNGTYWICDAFGLYCGPEPAPYQHPYIAT